MPTKWATEHTLSGFISAKIILEKRMVGYGRDYKLNKNNVGRAD